MGWLWIVVAALVGLTIWNDYQRQARIDAARERYAGALAQLKKRPANPDLRQSALVLGRTLSDLLRDKKGRTTFDEVALMNDINAACAAAHVASSGEGSANTASIEERLRHLKDLLNKQLIDETEYSQRRQEILQQV